MQNKFGLESHPNPTYIEPIHRSDSLEYKTIATDNASEVALWWIAQHPELLDSEDTIAILVKSIADDLKWPRSDVYAVLNTLPGIEVYDPFAQYKQELADRRSRAMARATRHPRELWREQGPFDYLEATL